MYPLERLIPALRGVLLERSGPSLRSNYRFRLNNAHFDFVLRPGRDEIIDIARSLARPGR